MIVLEKSIKFLSAVFDASNKLHSLVGEGIKLSLKDLNNIPITEIFSGSEYELIEQLCVKSIISAECQEADYYACDGSRYSITVCHEDMFTYIDITLTSANESSYSGLLNSIGKNITMDKNHHEFIQDTLMKVIKTTEVDQVILITTCDQSDEYIIHRCDHSNQMFETISWNNEMDQLYKWYHNEKVDVDTIVYEDVQMINYIGIPKICLNNNIRSLMMAPVYCNRKEEGLICFARKNTSKWLEVDEMMIKSIALLINQELSNDRVNRALITETKMMEFAIDSISEGIVITDGLGNIDVLNTHAIDVLGITNESWKGRKLSELMTCFNSETGEALIDPIDMVLECHQKIRWGEPFRVELLNHEPKIIDCCADEIIGPDGEIVGAVMLFWDMTSQLLKEEKLEYLSKYDEMTGLFNRNYLEVKFDEIDCQESYPLAVVLGDLNGLKLTNDAYGHETGDAMLKNAGSLISSTINGRGIAGRWGGDEFLMLLPNTNESEAIQFCLSIKEAFGLSSTDLSMDSISLGCSTKNSPQIALSRTIREAEDYMYKRKLMESKSLRSSLIKSIQQTLHEKSYETEAHAIRLCSLSKMIGQRMGLSTKELADLELVAMLHDIGKITVSNEILEKASGLTDQEWKVMKGHSESGFRILKAIPELSHVADYVLSHHERWDGKGYPEGLKEDQIPLLSRIISTVDSYDAMTNDRVYRKALSKEVALEEVRSNSGTQFDPMVVDAFLTFMID